MTSRVDLNLSSTDWWNLKRSQSTSGVLSGVKGIAIISFGRILYCMVVRLSRPKEWTIGLSLIIGHVSYWK